MAFINLAELKTYINAYIKTNGAGSITGSQLNTALLGMLQFVYEEDTLVKELSTDANYIYDPLLVNAIKVKVYSSVRLIDNSIAGTSYTDGYTFDPTTGKINFAATRASGEIFVIDYIIGIPVSPTTTTSSTTTTSTTSSTTTTTT